MKGLSALVALRPRLRRLTACTAPRRAPTAAVTAFVAAALAAGCAPALPPPEAGPVERLEWARGRFEREEYGAAIRGLEDFLVRQPYHGLADSARYLLGEAYLRSGQELLAASEFAELAITRPNSSLADDAQFGTCRAYWQLSPDLPLDQQYTERAVAECTRLIEYYPRSELVPDARDIRAAARQKLAAKELRTARWYLDNGYYESAVIYLESIVRNYPEADVMPEALAALYEAYDTIGFRSEAEQVRARLLEQYPDTAEARALRDAGPDAPDAPASPPSD